MRLPELRLPWSRGFPRNRPGGRDILLEHWGRWDIDAALGLLVSTFHPRPTAVLGHSAGTQLFGLAPLSRHVSGLISVASLVPWPANYAGPMRLGASLLFRLVLPALNAGRDRFPASRVGLSSVDVPSGRIGHVGFFREANRDALWGRVAGWLEERVMNDAGGGVMG